MSTVSNSLDMERARHAADSAPKLGEDLEAVTSVTDRMPGMVVTNGLGASLAFLEAKGEKDQVHARVYDNLQGWLINKSKTVPWNSQAEKLQDRLMEENSLVYRAAQAEALKYLSWLKRLAKVHENPRGHGPRPQKRRQGRNEGSQKYSMVIPKDTRISVGLEPVKPDEWMKLFPEDANASLLFTRFLPLWNQAKGLVIKADKRKALWSLANRASKCDASLLASIHVRQEERLSVLEKEGFKTVTCEVCQATPFVSRLGESHPFENGFFFHPLYGIPFLPGSGLKGAVRAALAKEFRKPLFGNEKKEEDAEHRGRAVFLDAFPGGKFRLQVDIMTPHHGEYLEGKMEPTDTKNPVPVPFLVVAPGAKWVFRVAVGPPLDSESTEPSAAELVDPVKEALERVLEWHGLGAKKSSGYGSFVTS